MATDTRRHIQFSNPYDIGWTTCYPFIAITTIYTVCFTTQKWHAHTRITIYLNFSLKLSGLCQSHGHVHDTKHFYGFLAILTILKGSSARLFTLTLRIKIKFFNFEENVCLMYSRLKFYFCPNFKAPTCSL